MGALAHALVGALTVGVGATPCSLNIGGIFQMRRTPAGLQREAAARAAFCDFFPNCAPGYSDFNIPNPNAGSVYLTRGNNSRLNVTYVMLSESSPGLNSDLSTALGDLIELILKWFAVAFLGPNSSSTSKAVSPLAQVYGLPHISYAATSTELSDTSTYPSFFRTCPPDAQQARAMVAFVKLAGWSTVAVLNSLDTYGATGAAEVLSQAEASGVAVATRQEFLSGERDAATLRSFLRAVLATRVRVLILFAREEDATPLMIQAQSLGMAGPGWVWIASDSLALAPLVASGLSRVAPGFLGFTPASIFANSQFDAMNTSWATQRNRPGAIVTNYRGQSASYTGVTSINPFNYSSYGASLNSYAPYAYDAMMVLLQTIDELAQNGTTPCNAGLAAYRANLTAALKPATISGTTGPVTFDANQDRGAAVYELVNHDGSKWNRVARWDSISGFEFIAPSTAETSPVWASGTTGIAAAPADVFVAETSDYRSRPYRLVFPIAAGSLAGFVAVAAVTTHARRESVLIKAATPVMMQLINLGCVCLCAAVGVMYAKPTTAVCASPAVLGHVGFALCFGPLFAKNWRISRIFYREATGRTVVTISNAQLMVPVGFTLAVVLAYVCVWLALDPPRPATRTDRADETVIYHVCSSGFWWYMALVILELAFMLVGVSIAWQTRHTPDIFNESRAVGTSLYAILFVSAVILATLLATRPDPDLEYAVFSLGVILAVATVQVLLNGERICKVWRGVRVDPRDATKTNVQLYRTSSRRYAASRHARAHGPPALGKTRVGVVSASPIVDAGHNGLDRRRASVSSGQKSPKTFRSTHAAGATTSSATLGSVSSASVYALPRFHASRKPSDPCPGAAPPRESSAAGAYSPRLRARGRDHSWAATAGCSTGGEVDIKTSTTIRGPPTPTSSQSQNQNRDSQSQRSLLETVQAQRATIEALRIRLAVIGDGVSVGDGSYNAHTSRLDAMASPPSLPALRHSTSVGATEEVERGGVEEAVV